MTQIQVDLDALNQLIARLQWMEEEVYSKIAPRLEFSYNRFDSSYDAINKAQVEESVRQFFRMLLQLVQQNDELIARLTERLHWLQVAQHVVFVKGEVNGLPTGSILKTNP